MTNTTDYNVQFVNIWQKSTTRQEAYRLIKENLDPDTTYKKVINRVKYMKEKKGIPLKNLSRDSIDWDAVKSAISLEN